MKTLIVILTGFMLSMGVALADPASSDCGDEEMEPIILSVQQS